MSIEHFFNDPSNLPNKVLHKDVGDVRSMEERFFDVEGGVGCILGMNKGSVEFCPKNDPPSKEEILAWLWVIRPQDEDEILSYSEGVLFEIICERKKRRAIEEQGAFDELKDISNSVNNLLKEYRKTALLYKQAEDECNFSLKDKASKKSIEILGLLVRLGEDKKIEIFLEDEEVVVQMFAATHLLEVEEKKAIKKLQEIKSNSKIEEMSITQMNASMIIDAWHSGKLKIRK